MATTPGGIAPGVLPYQEILRLCGLEGNELEESKETGPIQPCRRKNVRSASYDLRLGTDYHFSEPPKNRSSVRSMEVSRLASGTDEHIVLRPNQVVVVSTLEKVCLPDDMVGHLTLKQDILLQGLIMASQSQIDAGYEGWIFPLLYNLTDTAVTLQLDRSVIRLELVRLPERTRRPYEGDYQKRPLATSLKKPIGSSLSELRDDIERRGKEVDEERKRLNKTQVVALVVALAAIIVPFMSGFVGEVYEARDRVSRIEGQLDGSVKLDQQVDRLDKRVAELQCEVRNQGDPAALRRC